MICEDSSITVRITYECSIKQINENRIEAANKTDSHRLKIEQKSNDHSAESECDRSVRHDLAFETYTQSEKTKNFAVNNELNKQFHAEQINDFDHQSKNDRILCDVHRDIAEIFHFIAVISFL